jgi:hypothetical protein
MNSTFRLTRIVLPVIVLIAAVGTGQEIWSLEDAGLTSEEFGTIVALAQNHASLEVFEEHFGPLGRHLPDEWLEIAALPGLIDPDVDGSFVTHDAWGRPLLLRMVDNGFLFVSVGADGLPQFDYDAFEPRAFPEDAGSYSHPDDDIIYANGFFVSYPESVPAY